MAIDDFIPSIMLQSRGIIAAAIILRAAIE